MVAEPGYGGAEMDLSRFTHITFDCYGTLIDWETGILAALRRVLSGHGVDPSDVDLLRLYTRFEAELEAGLYRPYREILSEVSMRVASEFDVTLSEDERMALPESVGDWPPFSDTVGALERLGRTHRLVIVSNIDDRLFEMTRKRLGVEFADVVTAEQVRSYKPNPAHFEEMLRRTGAPMERVLHVAQSLYHDHVPAKRMGFATVWVNRPSRLPGYGLSPAVEVGVDWEVEGVGDLGR